MSDHDHVEECFKCGTIMKFLVNDGGIDLYLCPACGCHSQVDPEELEESEASAEDEDEADREDLEEALEDLEDEDEGLPGACDPPGTFLQFWRQY